MTHTVVARESVMQVRYDSDLRQRQPIMVHINSHPDKFPRMAAVEQFYVLKSEGALSSFPDGSE